MALKKCAECGQQISSKAEACPHCGVPLKKKSSSSGCASLIILVVLVFVAISMFVPESSTTSSSATSSRTKTPEQKRKEKIEKLFSGWDGSHTALTKFIKKSMNDPDSYEHVETRYADKGDHLLIVTTFRGKNSFGGVVKNSVIAKGDLDGNVLEIVTQDP